MRRYLLSIYQPDGTRRRPRRLAQVMADLDAVNRELKAAGAWVFAGGLHPPDTATVLRPRGRRRAHDRRPVRRGQGAHRRVHDRHAPDLDAALEWGRRIALATGLPIEVRPFQGETGD